MSWTLNCPCLVAPGGTYSRRPVRPLFPIFSSVLCCRLHLIQAVLSILLSTPRILEILFSFLEVVGSKHCFKMRRWCVVCLRALSSRHRWLSTTWSSVRKASSVDRLLTCRVLCVLSLCRPLENAVHSTRATRRRRHLVIARIRNRHRMRPRTT